jgi:hypothetical protein
MADFEALNELRSQTLRQIREMVSEGAVLWDRSFDGLNTSGMLADLERSRARFRALWVRHESIRQQMVEAGFMPPPVESEGQFETLVEDPILRQIEERLKAEMETARAEYYYASRDFRLFVAHGTGMPAPDGSLRAKQVAALHSAALRKYTGALRRFNAFLVNGALTEEQATPEP